MGTDLSTDLATDLATELGTNLAGSSVPAQLGALYEWDPLYGVTTATGVDSWACRISGTVLTQSTGSLQPTLVTTSAYTGRTMLGFDGADYLDVLSAPLSSIFEGGNAFTLYIESVGTAASTTDTRVGVGSTADIAEYLWVRTNSGDFMLHDQVTAAANQSFGINGGYVQNRAEWVYASADGTNLKMGCLDGTNAVARTANLTDMDVFCVGARVRNTTYDLHMVGELGRIAVWDRELTAAEHTIMQAYMSGGWS